MTGAPNISEIFYDIRKLYRFRTPCDELTRYVEFFSETSLEATARFIPTERFTVKLFPSFTPTVWINLGAPYILSNGNHAKPIDKTQDVLILRSTTIERNNFSSDNIFTIKFHPLGFESIYGFSQARIGNDILPVSEILPSGVLNKMKEPAALEDKCALLETFFLVKLLSNRSDPYHLNCIQRSIDLFHRANMNIRLSELASEVHVSEKTFNRYFHQIIGTNPKHFFSTVRCREALTRYKRDAGQFSPIDYGYYDFSHFSKDVKNFTSASLTSIMLP